MHILVFKRTARKVYFLDVFQCYNGENIHFRVTGANSNIVENQAKLIPSSFNSSKTRGGVFERFS